MGHARSLITIEKSEAQIEIYNTIINRGLSVRKTEDLVRSLIKIKKNKKIFLDQKRLKNLKENYHLTLEQKFIHQEIITKEKIIIPYNSTNDLNRILEILDII